MRRNFGQGGYVGILGSDRELIGSTQGPLGNRLGGLDANIPVSDDDSLTGAAFVSQTDGLALNGAAAGGAHDPFDDAARGVGSDAEVGWEHGGEHLQTSLRGVWASPDFRAENGFVTKADCIQAKYGATILAYPKSTIIPRVGFTPGQGYIAWNTEGQVRGYEVEPEFSARTSNGMHLHTSVFVDGELYDGAFLKSVQPNIGGAVPLTPWFGFYARVYAGTSAYYDAVNPRVGAYQSAEFDGLLQAGSHLSFSFTGNAEQMHELPSAPNPGALLCTALVGRLETDAFATPQLSARLTLDVSTFDDTRAAELLLAWEREPGTAIYAGGALGWTGADLTSWNVVVKGTWGIQL